MAQITIDELRRLVETNVDWRSRGEQSPHEVLDLSLWTARVSFSKATDADLARKTITYEGHAVTVVLDFDEHGYLQNIEFV